MHQTPATAKAATSKDLESTPDADSRKRVTVLISGSGSSLSSLLLYSHRGRGLRRERCAV